MPAAWDARYAELLERIMAAAVANVDPEPLKKELERLMAERPKETKHVEPSKRRRPGR